MGEQRKQGVIIRKITKDDIVEIALLHKTIFKNYLLTCLGTDLIMRYYNVFLENKTNLSYCAVFSGKIIGFIFIAFDEHNDIRCFYKQNYIRLFFRVLFGFLTFNRTVIKHFYAKLKSSFAFRKRTSLTVQTKPRLLSIGVDSEYQGKKVASVLVEKAEEQLRLLGVDEYGLSTKDDNLRAMNFYIKIGFWVTSRRDGGVYFSKKLI